MDMHSIIKLVLLLGVVACGAGTNTSMQAEPQVTADSSNVEFLLTSAAADFRAHDESGAIEVRKVRSGYVSTPNGARHYRLCGEFRSETSSEGWIPFATLETSGYEQWLGAQAATYCRDSGLTWLAGDLSSRLQQRLVSAAVNDTAGYTSGECPSCSEWNQPTAPVRLHGNTYYVGTRGLVSILITSPDGHILIDGGLPNSAPQVVRSIRQLGFREQDVKLILNSHAHYDHAGGLAALQRMTGAVVAASRKSAPVLRSGKPGSDDPQYEIALAAPPVSRVQEFDDGDTLRVGPLALVAQLTPGHTPGGTSWTWRACDDVACLNFVYADSQTPVSADNFYFTRSAAYPTAIADFEKAIARIEQLACDILITPHPGASNLWDRVAQKDGAQLVDRSACVRYAQSARQALAQRIAREQEQSNQ
jgi:metallo-beta-lactamase class B